MDKETILKHASEYLSKEHSEEHINELCKTICDIMGKEFNPIYLPDRPNEVKYANCSAKLAEDRKSVV